jgi:serine phosphatase RsbU (regulator of sigma subunit)/pSer/pThr/pTyr-binding forkhead associated (FHA) protein
MALLKRANGDAAGQIIELKHDRTIIGRSPEHCHIVLDPNGVSRRHAEIQRKGEDYFVADLNSRNQTKVNNTKLVPGSEHRLKPGDRINICDVEFLFYHRLPAETDPNENGEIVIVEGADSADAPHLHTLDASRSSAMASMVKPEVKLKAILEIARNLSTELKIDTVAPRILDSLMELFPQAERLFLILVDPQTKRLVRKAFRCRPGRRPHFAASIPDDEAQLSISRSIVNHVLVQKKAVLSQDASMDKNLPTSASIADLKIRSVMCVPLLTPDGQALGILQLDTSDRKQFHQEDLDVLTAVASQAAIAIQNAALHESMLERERLDRDLKLAEQVQKRFLPQSVPRIAGFEFFAHYDPAYEVGGDYYDFVQLPGNRCAVAVGDVSGKGVAAALMMAKFSGDTRYCILTENSPSAAANELNHLLFAAGIDEKFITLSLGILDVERRTLALSSAGHPPIMIRRVAGGRVEEVGEEIAGFPLGIIPGSDYKLQEVTLQTGDVAVVYSDGVTDARNLREELYHTRENPRLFRRLAETPGGPETVGRAIIQDIREYSAGHVQVDDITLICFGPVAQAPDRPKLG